ncbi:MAG: DUF2956 family protein [Gammaproteobacteria bacterium]
MARRSSKHQHREASQDEAMRIARGMQRPEQTREQTKLIAKGIRKGIEQYKKQQSARNRERDRRRKRARQQPVPPEVSGNVDQNKVIYRQHWLPWVLLLFSWVAMAVYWLVS